MVVIRKATFKKPIETPILYELKQPRRKFKQNATEGSVFSNNEILRLFRQSCFISWNVVKIGNTPGLLFYAVWQYGTTVMLLSIFILRTKRVFSCANSTDPAIHMISCDFQLFCKNNSDTFFYQCWITKQQNNWTILFNRAEYPFILANATFGPVSWVSGHIQRELVQ